MRYVRTKKGKIYERDKVIVVKENGVDIVLLSISADFVERTRGKTWNYGTNVVVKESDNLEELCDELVIVRKGKPFIPVYVSLEDLLMDPYYEGFEAVYGAIWMETGLKYVAKVNEKGELELL